MFGKVHNNWVDQCKNGEWKWLSFVAPKSYGDVGHLIIIFDSCDIKIDAKVSRIRLEGFDCEP